MKQFLKLLISLTISLLFFGLLYLVFNSFDLDLPFKILPFLKPVVLMIIISFIIGFVFYLLLSEFVVTKIMKFESMAENKLVNMNFNELISSVIGCILGLAIANLLGLAFVNIPLIGTVIVIILNVIFAFLGIRVATKRKDEFSFFTHKASKTDKNLKTYGRPKILDTSVIIDGRILDILQTGFIEGKLIIPDFVLEELRHIADSSDNLKRNRGRRGLDILNEIQKQTNIPVETYNWDSKDTDDVDTKLLKMGAKLDAFVVTNDFNLNKVAEFQKVSVLNINDLSRAIKSVVLPGENIQVTVIKDGKENHQGIAYLEDGTMIVVEGGSRFIGEIIGVTVTSVLQTSAGRMIFAKIRED